MIKISHEIEAEALNILPIEVVTKVTKIAAILDDNYGRQRDVDYNLGGYVLVAEVAKDIETIRKLIDLGYTLQEYVELIVCSTGQCYTNSLILLNNDYCISLMIPFILAPKELLACIDE